MNTIRISNIIDQIILSIDLEPSLGVDNGQMSAVIALCTYLKHHKDETVHRILEECITSILSKIEQTPLSERFSDGVPGIAWGICYLYQSTFLRGEIPEILEDFDLKIREIDLPNLFRLSKFQEIERLLHYILFRSEIDQDYRCSQRKYLATWDTILEQSVTKSPELETLNRIYYNKQGYTPQLLFDSYSTPSEDSSLCSLPIGLNAGLSRLLINELTI